MAVSRTASLKYPPRRLSHSPATCSKYFAEPVVILIEYLFFNFIVILRYINQNKKDYPQQAGASSDGAAAAASPQQPGSQPPMRSFSQRMPASFRQ